MNPHLKPLVVAQVVLRVAVYAAAVAGLQAGNFKRERLFVQLGNLALARVDDTCHAGRKNVVHRFAVGILLDVNHRHVEIAFGRKISAAVEVEVVGAPLAAHKLKSGETQVCDLFESGHEHARESYGREVANRSDNLLVCAEGYLELIPLGCLLLSVAGQDHRRLFIGDEVLPDNEVLRADGDPILEIAFVFVECIVLVDVFHIGHRTCALVERV